MREKFSKKITPIEGALYTLDNLKNRALGIIPDSRYSAINTKINDQVIDTVCPEDIGCWETGIKRNGKWIIVEQYPDEETAIKGHEEWVVAITNDPDMELVDCDVWNLKSLENIGE